jgi:hypothetical protein
MTEADNNIIDNDIDVALGVFNIYGKHYYWPLFQKLKENQLLLGSLPKFLFEPEKISLYLFKSHFAIEYYGDERPLDSIPTESKEEVSFHDFMDFNGNILQKIIGLNFDDHTSKLSISLPSINDNYLLATNRGYDKLLQLKWNFNAYNQGLILSMNTGMPEIGSEQFVRIRSSFFFDEKNGSILTRHVKWLDFFPWKLIDNGDQWKIGSYPDTYSKILQYDLSEQYTYPLPNSFEDKRLERVNNFTLLWGDNERSEPDITSFLARNENRFILSMAFGSKHILPEALCKWQNGVEDQDDIKPDFFIINSSGYGDIVEFKKPLLNYAPINGKANREKFSAEVNSYIAQTRVYENYFDDSQNRQWFKNKYGFEVYKPKRILVLGRDFQFDRSLLREIENDYKNIKLMTYDELVDTVKCQFYM